jgi:hypothetical protein
MPSCCLFDWYRYSGSCARLVSAALVALVLVACAGKPYQQQSLDSASFLQRTISQQQGELRVSVAVPDAAETLSLTGLDLYQQGIQPIWLKIENTGNSRVRATFRSIDPNYFSPIEVAYMNRGGLSKGAYAAMEAWFHSNGMRRHIGPGETRSGLVFTNLNPGTKAFNLDIFKGTTASHFTFFVRMPGYTAVHQRVDFDKLYADTEIMQLDESELQTALENELPCCSINNLTGIAEGLPLNLVLVGSPLAVRSALMRGDWIEADAQSPVVQRILNLELFDRAADAIFYQIRQDGVDEQIIAVALWLAPWEVNGEPVWAGIAYYGVMEEQLLQKLMASGQLDLDFRRRFARESVAADIDQAPRFVLQNFWYNQSLRQFGLVSGVGASTEDNPHETYLGASYFTQGKRYVLYLSEQPVALDKTRIIYGFEALTPTTGIFHE